MFDVPCAPMAVLIVMNFDKGDSSTNHNHV